MKNLNNIETELNAIRIALYEEMKGMSPSEMNEYMKAKTEPFHEKYGIHPVNKLIPDKRKAVL